MKIKKFNTKQPVHSELKYRRKLRFMEKMRMNKKYYQNL